MNLAFPAAPSKSVMPQNRFDVAVLYLFRSSLYSSDSFPAGSVMIRVKIRKHPSSFSKQVKHSPIHQ